ncbi:CGNR zinc finger domain-containing protein [Rhizobium sp. CFBP 8752]|uniref:CGNR zinc finger domain-containing protein n=1 Tax=Rhizobium sp. CFBP 8752 TaxID=2775301 RepID=UPI00177CB927|nr:CGNR zinc finger domain-containing protein [Rhizobium sp. CFBP 8752]MBD8663615.1 CGNR zinc finger domain-containing protein [Rhizobium sp. CFBP 8752]
MDFTWTPHRFVGGALALDVANSVILRIDPSRRIDRFASPQQMDAFPEAAGEFSAERALFGEVTPVAAERRGDFLVLREAIDRYFRARADGEDDPHKLADLLGAAAVALRGTGTGSLEAATARSALRLLGDDQISRLKSCRNCGWLFIDRSRNRSRSWCDMTVCGNRVKANRHYRRSRGGGPSAGDAT